MITILPHSAPLVAAALRDKTSRVFWKYAGLVTRWHICDVRQVKNQLQVLTVGPIRGQWYDVPATDTLYKQPKSAGFSWPREFDK
jgi:hypothetical protein